MFNLQWHKRRENQLRAQIDILEERIVELRGERERLFDENHNLKTENKTLKVKRQIDEEQIAHKIKMREEQVDLDYKKKLQAAEAKKQEDVAKVKDEYRDKLENELKKRGDELKEMYKQILERLPNVNMAIRQKS